MANERKFSTGNVRGDSASTTNMQKLTLAIEKKSASTANLQSLASSKPSSAPASGQSSGNASASSGNSQSSNPKK